MNVMLVGKAERVRGRQQLRLMDNIKRLTGFNITVYDTVKSTYVIL